MAPEKAGVAGYAHYSLRDGWRRWSMAAGAERHPPDKCAAYSGLRASRAIGEPSMREHCADIERWRSRTRRTAMARYGRQPGFWPSPCRSSTVGRAFPALRIETDDRFDLQRPRFYNFPRLRADCRLGHSFRRPPRRSGASYDSGERRRPQVKGMFERALATRQSDGCSREGLRMTASAVYYCRTIDAIVLAAKSRTVATPSVTAAVDRSPGSSTHSSKPVTTGVSAIFGCCRRAYHDGSGDGAVS